LAIKGFQKIRYINEDSIHRVREFGGPQVLDIVADAGIGCPVASSILKQQASEDYLLEGISQPQPQSQQ
jgi:hypothetical protein